jgi:4-hydroxybenzoate polyprenyltransferase
MVSATPTYLLKVSRPGFWLTQIWFYLLPLSQVPVLDSWRFWLGVAYVSFGLGFILYGWNDLADADTDQHNPRKGSFLFGARGTRDQLRRLPRQIFLVQLPFVALFTWIVGPAMLLWFAALVGTAALYNHFPPRGLKGRPPFELLNQLGYLLVFVFSSWLNRVPQVPWPTFVFGALFAMHSHLFGEIMDVGPDRAAGRRTTAAMIGIQRAKLLLTGFLVAESMLVIMCFQNRWLAVGLAMAASWFVADARWIWRDGDYTTGQMRFFFFAWNAVALVSMPWIWRSAALTAMK